MKRPRTFGEAVRGKGYKRTYKKKASPSRQLTQVKLGLGFPARVAMKHRYRESFTLSATTGVMGVQNFCCNGMYDTNLTGTGHQPMYYDQMAALYDHYTVTGAKITVTASPSTQSNVVGSIGIFENDDASTAPTSIDFIGEQTTGIVQYVPANSTDKFVMTRYYKPKKIWGASPLAKAEQQGAITANPSEQTVWTIAVNNITSGATLTFVVTVDIVFDAVWTEVKDQAGS